MVPVCEKERYYLPKHYAITDRLEEVVCFWIHWHHVLAVRVLLKGFVNPVDKGVFFFLCGHNVISISLLCSTSTIILLTKAELLGEPFPPVWLINKTLHGRGSQETSKRAQDSNGLELVNTPSMLLPAHWGCLGHEVRHITETGNEVHVIHMYGADAKLCKE